MTPDFEICSRYELGVVGPNELLRDLGITPRMDGRDLTLDAYASQIIKTPLFSHLTYLFVAVGALLFLLHRRRLADVTISLMLISALVYTASFFVIAIACDYRYLLYLDVATLVAVFYIALTTHVAWWPKRNADTS
jgi:hypothetical protein